MLQHNWLSPKAQVRPAGAKGLGSFALEQIPAGEKVVEFGGTLMHGADLARLPKDRQQRSIQVDDDLYLVSNEVGEDGDRVNHSCEPNCGMTGAAEVVAMRDIAPGEELTFDYAMCDASDYDEFTCHCGVSNCRGVVTGGDWRDPVLQRKYDGYFSDYLRERITGLPSR